MSSRQRILGGRGVALAAALSLLWVCGATATGAGAAATVATPGGEWLATNVTTSVTGGVANDHVGNRFIRGWAFERVCSKGACHTDLLRTTYGGGLARGTLVPVAGGFAVAGPPLPDDCAREPGQPVRRETIDSTVTIRWLSATQLSGSERQVIHGCGGPPGVVVTMITAARVAMPRVTIAVSRRHAATRRAFARRAATICRALDLRERPIAAAIAAAGGLARTATSTAEKERAEADVARQIPRLVPLLTRQFEETPQPPVGPLDLAWLRLVDTERALAAPEDAAFAALADLAGASRDYFRTGSTAYADRAVAEGLFVARDVARLAAVARKLGRSGLQPLPIPAACLDPPALRVAFSAV